MDLSAELKRVHDEEGIRFSELADRVGISRSTISQVANQGLRPKPDQEAKLWAELERIRSDSSALEAEPLPMPSTFKSGVELYETKEYKEAMGWCSYVYRKRKMGVLVGYPGSGKTTVLRHFAEVQAGVLYIEAWHTMRVGDLLEAIGQAVGVNLNGNSQQKVTALMNELRDRDDVLIAVDEAEYLCRRNVDKMEVLRKIWDNTGTPVILCGTQELEKLLTHGKGGDNLAQLYRRKVELKLKGIVPAEAKAILRDYNVAPGTAEALAAIAGDVKHGGMGTFVEVLDLCLEAAEGGQITNSILNSAKRYKLMY